MFHKYIRVGQEESWILDSLIPYVLRFSMFTKPRDVRVFGTLTHFAVF